MQKHNSPQNNQFIIWIRAQTENFWRKICKEIHPIQTSSYNWFSFLFIKPLSGHSAKVLSMLWLSKRKANGQEGSETKGTGQDFQDKILPWSVRVIGWPLTYKSETVIVLWANDAGLSQCLLRKSLNVGQWATRRCEKIAFFIRVTWSINFKPALN